MCEPSKTRPVGQTEASLVPVEVNPQMEENGLCDWLAMTLKGPQLFRHRGWEPTRKRVWEALREAGAPVSRRTNFAQCGRSGWVLRSNAEPIRVAVRTNKCHDRFCVSCANDRAATVRAAVRERMGNERYRFVTLTLKHSDAGLAEKLQELGAAFGALRRTKLWQKAVLGGFAVTEIKRVRATGCWNVHLHALVHGKYLDQTALKNAWHRITGDSFIVDVRAVRDANNAADYTAKYATKGFDGSVTESVPVLVEAVRALAGKRLITTFGDWRGFALTGTEPTDAGWTLVGSYDEVRRWADNGDASAKWLLDTWVSSYTHDEPPPEPYPGDPIRPPTSAIRYAAFSRTTQRFFEYDGNINLDWAAV